MKKDIVSKIFLGSLLLLGMVTTSSALTQPFCYSFEKDLALGDSSQEIVALRRALAAQGLLAATNMQSSSFDTTLAKAVIAFQEKYAAEILTPSGLTRGNGRVGPKTRVKLNALYTCTRPTVTASPTILPTPSPVATQAVLPQNMPRISNVSVSSPLTLKKNDSKQASMVTFTFSFSVINDNDDPVYISKNKDLALGWTSNLDSAGAFISYISSPQAVSIVLPNAYYVPPRSSRKFEAIAVLNNTDNPGGPIGAYINIPRILYSTSTASIVQPSEAKSIWTGQINSGIIRLGS